MKKTGRKTSAYWQEVSQLFIKAGAFGIINLFDHPHNISERILNKGTAIHYKAIPDLHNQSLTESDEISAAQKIL